MAVVPEQQAFDNEPSVEEQRFTDADRLIERINRGQLALGIGGSIFAVWVVLEIHSTIDTVLAAVRACS